MQIEEILRVMKVGRSERSMNQSSGKRHYSTLASKPKIILSLTTDEFKKTGKLERGTTIIRNKF